MEKKKLIIMKIYNITSWITPNRETNKIPHPGGICPLTITNCDSTYYFEIYHHTDYSLKILKKFHIGTLLPEDKTKPPLNSIPSPDFLKRLHKFTDKFT